MMNIAVLIGEDTSALPHRGSTCSNANKINQQSKSAIEYLDYALSLGGSASLPSAVCA